MQTSTSAALGVAFLLLAILTTYLMFQFWGYPYDKDRRKSECPQWKMNIHRACGYGYVLIYLVLMSQMLPRLWNYQVEFPARTALHITFGMTIGVLLLVKISILRWFRHLEEWMPVLGVSILLCTVLLSGLSLPFVFKEQHLASTRAFGLATQERLLEILPATDLAALVGDVEELTSEASLRQGRQVLLGKCTHCHDLRTVIERPRTPADWVRIVQRMAGKPSLGKRIEDTDQARVAAYLMAITPELQESAKASRQAAAVHTRIVETLAATGNATIAVESGAATEREAQLAYETKCSQCHELSEVEDFPPESTEEVHELVARMVDNGLEAEAREIDLIKLHLLETFVE